VESSQITEEFQNFDGLDDFIILANDRHGFLCIRTEQNTFVIKEVLTFMRSVLHGRLEDFPSQTSFNDPIFNGSTLGELITETVPGGITSIGEFSFTIGTDCDFCGHFVTLSRFV